MGDTWTTVGHATPTDRIWRWDQEEQEKKVIDSWHQEERWPSAHKPILEGQDAKRFDSRLARLEVMGSGAFGSVEKVSYRSVHLARKRIGRRGFKIDDLRQEGLNMRKLSHEHVVRLVGQYILPSRELCLLIWPAAVCTLGDFLEDLEHFRLGLADRDDILDRFARLGLRDLRAVDPRPDTQAQSVSPDARCPLEYLRSIVGCTAQALAYCHEAKVRHNDIKPSNILLMPDRVYLADFGVSKDVSDLDHTTTEGQPGTEKWRAPELYSAGKRSMQLADIYSLGLVYLNIATVLYNGRIDEFDAVLRYNHNLDQTRQQMLARRGELLAAFIDRLSEFALAIPPHRFQYAGQETVGPRPLLELTRRMTETTPKNRPEATEVNKTLSVLGGVHQSYHGSCCKRTEDWVVNEWNTKLEALVTENSRQRKRIAELEGKDQTYERRIENERRIHEQHLSSLQKRLEEAEQRCRQMVQDNGRRRLGHSNSQGKRNSQIGSSPTAIPGVEQSRARMGGQQHRPAMQPKFHSAQQTMETDGSRLKKSGPRRLTPVLRASTAPVTQRSLYTTNGVDTDQRRNSNVSRIPLPITPTRTGTPLSVRDQSSTDSSLASSVFSRRSIETTPTPVQSSPSLLEGDEHTAVRVRVPPAPDQRAVPVMEHSESWASSASTATSSPETFMVDLSEPRNTGNSTSRPVEQSTKGSIAPSWAEVLRKM